MRGLLSGLNDRLVHRVLPAPFRPGVDLHQGDGARLA